MRKRLRIGLSMPLVDERAKAFEVVLVLELERPAQHGDQVDIVLVLQLEESLCMPRRCRPDRACRCDSCWPDSRATSRRRSLQDRPR